MKDIKTFKILTACGLIWIIPINRWYLGEPAIARTITGNWFYFGVVADLLFIDRRFDEAMAKRGYVNTTKRA